MGSDMGLLVSASGLPPRVIAAATRAAWGTAALPDAVVASFWHVRRPVFGRALELSTISVAPVEAAPELALDRVARAASGSLRARIAAAFVADHYCLGGYQLFDAGRCTTTRLAEDDYSDGPRGAFEQLTGATITLGKGEFFDRWLWQQVDNPPLLFALASRGRWLATPRRVELTDEEWAPFAPCYVLDYFDRPSVAPKLRVQAWRGVVRAWAERQVAAGATAYLKENGYREFRSLSAGTPRPTPKPAPRSKPRSKPRPTRKR